MSATETLRLLRGYVAQGYVLHGSPRRLEVIEPRQASDSHNRETGIQLAVYATSDLRPPLVRATVQPKRGSSMSGYSGDDKSMRVHGTNVELRPGFVHVLPPDSFEWYEANGERELISRTPVTPIAIIAVEHDILYYVEGVTVELEA